MNSVSTYNARSTKSIALSVDPNTFEHHSQFVYKPDSGLDSSKMAKMPKGISIPRSDNFAPKSKYGAKNNSLSNSLVKSQTELNLGDMLPGH